MSNIELARALFEAFEEGDDEAAREICAKGLRAIQNGSEPMDLESLLKFSRAVRSVVTDFRYDDAVRSTTQSGFVEEHRVRAALPDGSELDLAACVVAEVEDGKVIELREYFDGAAAAGLAKALAGSGR